MRAYAESGYQQKIEPSDGRSAGWAQPGPDWGADLRIDDQPGSSRPDQPDATGSGSDPKNTNYAGGNTSAKGTETDPVTGEPVELLWVKGSGGDLGTLKESGLAVLRLDRMRRWSTSTRASTARTRWSPRSTTACTARAARRRRSTPRCTGWSTRPTSTTCIPTRASRSPPPPTARQLTEKIFGDKVVWVPWRRPGFQLGLDIAEIKAENPQAIGCILGGHGITAWGDTSEESEANSLWIIDTAAAYIAEHTKAEPFGPALDGYGALPEAERRAKAAALAPTLRSIASHDRPMVGHFTDDRRGAGLPGLAPSTRGWPRWAPAARTTSCAPRSSRWCSTCPPTRRSRSRSPG